MSSETGNYSDLPRQEPEEREMIAGPFGANLDKAGFRLERPTKPLLTETDTYGNEYWVSDGVVEIVPDASGFEERFKTVITFAHNFLTLRRNGIEVPDFDAGIEIRNDDPEPYFFTQRINGETPQDDVSDEMLLEIEDVYQDGRELSIDNSILYTEPLLYDDLMITDENSADTGRVKVTNPGTYVEDYFEQQIRDSELDFSLEEIERMSEEEYWR